MSNLFLSAKQVEQAYREGKSRFGVNARFSSLCMQSHNIDSRFIHSGQIQFSYNNNTRIGSYGSIVEISSFHHLKW
jgi:hypothetical protein